MTPNGFWLLLLLQSCVSAGLCRILAVEKNYPKHKIDNWMIAGFCFGIFALIAAAGLPDRKGWGQELEEPRRSFLDRLPKTTDVWDED